MTRSDCRFNSLGDPGEWHRLKELRGDSVASLDGKRDSRCSLEVRFETQVTDSGVHNTPRSGRPERPAYWWPVLVIEIVPYGSCYHCKMQI